MIPRLLACLLLVALAGGASPVAAQAPVELSFYYPVAVGGPVTKIIDGLAADFQKENPGIHVKPIYAGTYQETIVKVLTALKSGQAVVIKNKYGLGRDQLLFPNAPQSIKFASGENPKRVFGSRNQLPSTRMGNFEVQREALVQVGRPEREGLGAQYSRLQHLRGAQAGRGADLPADPPGGAAPRRRSRSPRTHRPRAPPPGRRRSTRRSSRRRRGPRPPRAWPPGR